MIITTCVCYKMKKGHSTLVMFPFAPPQSSSDHVCIPPSLVSLSHPSYSLFCFTNTLIIHSCSPFSARATWTHTNSCTQYNEKSKKWVGRFAFSICLRPSETLLRLWHGNRKPRRWSDKAKWEKKTEQAKSNTARERDVVSARGWLQIKGQHSRNSFLLRPSSSALPAALSSRLLIREEMASPTPEDLQTS